ncbi:epiplakin-like [Malaclemys terrapin pileata]|uniref:epiplakin-like n=1 Tax=Malaclemys terrapin pileata TaxID=2991368 RepID=UPI0023A8FD52|nr:epiplakin-like [Malaclemys terrapin pileata]
MSATGRVINLPEPGCVPSSEEPRGRRSQATLLQKALAGDEGLATACSSEKADNSRGSSARLPVSIRTFAVRSGQIFLFSTLYECPCLTEPSLSLQSCTLPQEIGEDLPTTEAAKREGTTSQTVNPEQLGRQMESWQAATAYEEMGPGGINAIAGVLVQSTKEKMSLYQAMMRGVLTPGTALVLLEAQAAMGFIIDPVRNKKVPVRDALAAGLTGGDYYGKLLSAERAVTGYTDPYTGNKISLFQAMERDLIVKDHGIRLLEAQIATGGIIDPVHSHRIPVEVAYKRGYFDQELNRILSDPQNHSRSCFDPNTHENLTYMQLLSRCVPDPDTGLLMLQLMHKSSVLFQLDEKTRTCLQSAPATVSVGLFQGQKVTVWELLFSRYVPDQKRQELLKKYKAGTLTIQEMTTIITTLITEAEQKSSREPRPVKSPSTQRATSQKAEAAHSQRDEKREKALKTTTVDGLGGEFQGRKVSVWDLLFSKYVLEEKRQELLNKYRAGTLTIQDMITILTTSVTEAEGKSRKLPTTRKTPSKETRTPSEKDKDATSCEEQQTEKALKSTLVEVPAGEFHGRKVSVWDLLFSKYIPEEKRKELLELHRAGILTTDQMKTIVTTIVSKTEEKSHHLPGHGESPSAETTTSEDAETPGSLCDKHLENTLRLETVDVPVGEFKWQEVSLWELLFSSYISETKRQELLNKYRAGTLTIQGMITILTTSITEAEGKSRKLLTTRKTHSKETRTPSEKDKDATSCEEQQTEKALKSTLVEVPAGEFHGRKVSVWDLLFSKYIPEEKRKELLELHRAGILTTDQMKTIVTTIISKTEEKSHHLPGQGESPSAETTTSEDAETPGSLCDKHLENTLRSETVDVPVGEFKWQEVSLWELLFSSYISETKRQELLNKYRAGTLTIQEMITILTTSVTEAEGKSRKLPTTRKTSSKETRPLSEKDKDAPSREEQQTEKALKSTLVEVPAGEFHGRKVSVWDLLFSKYIPEEKRKELLELHRAGILTTDQMKTIVTTIVSKTEEKSHHLLGHGESPSAETTSEAEDAHSQEKHLKKSLKRVTIYVNAGEFQGQNVSLLDLLFSKHIPQEKRQELLALYRTRVLTIDQMIPIITSIITTTEATSRQFMTSVKSPNRDEITSQEAIAAHSLQDTQLDNILKATTIDGPGSEFQGRKVSVWDLLFSSYIPEEKRQELLELYRAGILTTDQVITVVTTLIKKKEATSRKFVINVKTPSKDTMTLEKAEDIDLHEDKKLEKALKSTLVEMPAGEFHGRKVSVWDLLFSNYIPEEKRQELLELYRAGILTMDQVITVVTTIVTKIGATRRKLATNVHSPSAERAPLQEADAAYSERNENQEMVLKSTTVDGPRGEFQGPKVSVWDLLFSKYVPKETRQELLEKHRTGTLTTEKMITSLTTSVSHALEEGLSPDNQQILNLLQSDSYVTVGQFQDQRVSVWELLSSKCVSQYNREVHLDTYNAGRLAVNEITITTTVITGSEGKKGAARNSEQH